MYIAGKIRSIEPMIGLVRNINLKGIDWVIVGGESGPGCRTIMKDWVEDVRDQCLAGGIPFFFKQWGGFNKKKAGRRLAEKEWSQYPPPEGPCKLSGNSGVWFVMKLTENEKRNAIKLIEVGKPLPGKYRFLLFDDDREVELIWNGNTVEVCILKSLEMITQN